MTFHPLVAHWFREAFGEPTPAQALGWPPIATGKHTLIQAPTGSGKTLAAFLYAIDELVREPWEEPGVHTLYISPLKALGYDIERNLNLPLSGIRELAQARGEKTPEIRVGVRTGDTSQAERQRLVRRPPHILITTPESLNLMLTSPRARETLRTVRRVIVDEIHALAPEKRGTFLALLLERLEELAPGFQRIGLSATIRPLSEVARFLGGYEEQAGSYIPREVEIVDAGLRKDLDVQVLSPVPDMAAMPEDTIWPAIYQKLLELIQAHRSTIVFVNSRRAAERITAELNELAGYEIARVHHGSVAKERRRALEEALKAGEIPALVATTSLELGIDMGLVDLVCQVESPRSVARALQRVGRAGHLFGAAAKGRLLPKTRGDLLELAALAWGMREVDLAPIKIPKNPLDILAQQVVAMTAAGPLPVKKALSIVRRAYPYRDLPDGAFRRVLSMLSGRMARTGFPLRARISWDTVHDVLYPLPGTRHVAVTSGGAIPETGQFGVYTESGDRIGELDEEFVWESREGEVIMLGTSRWRILSITHDRVVVTPAEGPAKLPFWRGEIFSRDITLGRRVGALAREIEARLSDPGLVPWLMEECALDRAAAENLVRYVERQHERSVVPTDRRVVIEGFPDEAGGLRVAVLTPYGGRFHLAWSLALLSAFRRHSLVPDALHSEGGILFRFTGATLGKVVEILRSLTPENLEEHLLSEVSSSPLFGLRFRQNAARALLLPRARPGRRTPLWLQRLKARDLLAAAKGEEGFPIVYETLRELLSDFLPMEELKGFLGRLRTGEVELVVKKLAAPSPFSASLLFEFQATYLYQWDEPKAAPVEAPLPREDLSALLGRDLAGEIDPEAVEELTLRFRARTGAELVELVRQAGDLSQEEVRELPGAEALAALPSLISSGRLSRLKFPDVTPPERIVAGEDVEMFRRALAGDGEAQAEIIRRHVLFHGFVPLKELLSRYPFPEGTIRKALQEKPFLEVKLRKETCFTTQEVLSRLRGITLARRRRAFRPRTPAAFQCFLLRYQRRHPQARAEGEEGLREVLSLLQGVFLSWQLWDLDILPNRVAGYRRGWLSGLLRAGELSWWGRPGPGRELLVTFAFREDLPWLRAAYPPGEAELSPLAGEVKKVLAARGASFPIEISGELAASTSQVEGALWELARAGIAASDGLEPLLAGPPPIRASKKKLWPGGRGRWALLPVPGELGDEELEKLVKLFLSRYGVISRGILRMDGAAVPWGRVCELLSRLEWRGEVVRGALVQGLSGAQFAREEVLSGLREEPGWGILPACDPAAIWGAGAPFPLTHPLDPDWRLRRAPGNFLVLQGGIPVLAIEAWGERLIGLADLTPEELRGALSLLPRLLSGPVRRLRVRSWNGRPVRESKVEDLLVKLGFSRDPQALILYRR
ncbi:MAG: DEAD/H associated domain protein [Acetothermia bacterium 64_32]|nr:MAG: DEAD/H associated domain protein [Acetothermia bacterium 64_32]HAF70842.1 DEAD/DEAH box helicase [Candidatus Acetothermia bacterium]